MDPGKKGVALQEDDDFEDFDVEDWGAAQQNALDPSMWETGWDNENLQDGFAQNLRAVLKQEIDKPQPASNAR